MTRQWRNFEELARSPAFLARAAREFPSLANAPHDRRQVLRLMAAAIAMAGLNGCDDGEPSGGLIPPVRPSPQAVQHAGNLYATASVLSGYATGTVIRHDAGRPIKVEGNPLHPASLGGTDAIAQAEILGFYDPYRAAGISRNGVMQDHQTLAAAMAAQRDVLAQTHGEGFRILTGSTTSPTLLRQLIALRQRFPGIRWHQWEPVSRDAVRTGGLLAYGKPVEVLPRLATADVILAIDSDLLSSAPGHVRYAREFASRRNPARDPRMNRVFAIEPTPTLIGVAADHRFIAGPADLNRAVQVLANAILHGVALSSDSPQWVRPILHELQANRGRAFVHVGPHQTPEMHALAHVVNEALGGRGATFELIDAVEAEPGNQAQSLHDLIHDMHEGTVQSLFVIDCNPAFTAPVTLGFAQALDRVPFSLALTIEPNETSARTTWALPHAHPLEDWSDARAFDGSATIMQPQAQPLYDGISPHHLLAMLNGFNAASSLDIVRETWRATFHDFDGQWHDALASGIVADTASATTDVRLKADAAHIRIPDVLPRATTLLFRPDPYVWDGRFANNAWLQELPRPLTKLTWDNPLLISPEQGRALKVKNGDHVAVQIGTRRIELPAWIMPGQAADCAVALLGFGRSVIGAAGSGTGFDVHRLIGHMGPVQLHKGKGNEQLASTEHHDPMFARDEDFARHGTLSDFMKDSAFLADHVASPSLYRRKPPGPAEWGMSIDLNACVGCNACVVACMAENNIPVVGKEQVIREREMHWLRIDRYYEGSPDEPKMYFQPVLCMHCEQAPCETVCPVGATVHDSEGLNVMVYNRCIGTRFCSNNCPYKVRRFNFYGFAQEEHRSPLARNPEVTVRGRGVMEKCTFCLQRIAAARIKADIENRPVAGNEVRTACQAACPTQAFSFGNMADPEAEVIARKQSPLTYALLADQNTHPRVTYEARITNPGMAEGGQV